MHQMHQILPNIDHFVRKLGIESISWYYDIDR